MPSHRNYLAQTNLIVQLSNFLCTLVALLRQRSLLLPLELQGLHLGPALVFDALVLPLCDHSAHMRLQLHSGPQLLVCFLSDKIASTARLEILINEFLK